MKKNLLIYSAMLSTVFVLATCGDLQLTAAQTSREESEITQLEDCGVPNYYSEVHRQLERQVPAQEEFAEDWALCNFVIDADGKVHQARLLNSTGNAEFDSTVLKRLSLTRVPPLPDGCGEKVRATHAFNYRKATRNKRTANKRNTQLAEKHPEAATDGRSNYLTEKVMTALGATDPNSIPNVKALLNIAFNLAEIALIFFVMGSLFGGSNPVVGFFFAFPAWWIHRLLLGKFPE